MKTPLLTFILLISFTSFSKITTPVIKAAFGVDGELRANYFNGFIQSGNDDWFNNGTLGTGQMVIDTTGAAALLSWYAGDASPWPRRMNTFYRGMSRRPFAVVNNRLWLDALFVRDYHGDDTTVFAAGSNKNGMSPADWTCPVSQAIPDKNDILDMMMHVRRAGPSTTDSLWFFGALSLDNTTGNRYFDFELYQTDIYYDRASRKWYGYGPDMGHTSWKFDAVGNIISPGDVIFSAEYQSSMLSNIEARIWVDRAALSLTPTTFSWSGTFDGASNGSQYGYAGIRPNTLGPFYTGLGSGNNTWAGPFQVVLQDNSVVTNYTRDQFMEFSVNLTKLGLDPVTVFGTDFCGTPFNRLVVKTRASASFTAELKDFVAPIDLFLAPRVDAIADVPIYCGTMGVSNLSVTNPSPTSYYTWSTLDGHIVGSSIGPNIQVDTPGTYIVQQQLAAGCNPYAYDTLSVVFDENCSVLPNRLLSFSGSLKDNSTLLKWTVANNSQVKVYEVEISADSRVFTKAGSINATYSHSEIAAYSYDHDLSTYHQGKYYYRLKIIGLDGSVEYSKIVSISTNISGEQIKVYPVPAVSYFELSVTMKKMQEGEINIFDVSGKPVKISKINLREGMNTLNVHIPAAWPTGVYLINLKAGELNTWKKVIVDKTGTMKL